MCVFACGVSYCGVESEVGIYQVTLVNRPSAKFRENPLRGSVIVGICQDGRTDTQTNVVVLMSSFVQLHVVNSRNDSPNNICTVVSCRVCNVYCNF
jgi:hypothetical protein